MAEKQVRLSQVIGNEPNIKKKTHEQISTAYQTIQKTDVLSGQNRVYKPLDDEGERLPPEKQLVRAKASDLLKTYFDANAEWLNIQATKDWGNMSARADIVVDGVTVAEQVPTSFLLMLEKHLVDVHTMISKITVLDNTKEWVLDANEGVYKTEPVISFRTQKVMKNHEKAPATDKHPAQVETYTVDEKVGVWETTYLSGAMPAEEKRRLLERVQKLQQAVRDAREEANTIKVSPQTAGDKLIAYLTAK